MFQFENGVPSGKKNQESPEKPALLLRFLSEVQHSPRPEKKRGTGASHAVRSTVPGFSVHLCVAVVCHGSVFPGLLKEDPAPSGPRRRSKCGSDLPPYLWSLGLLLRLLVERARWLLRRRRCLRRLLLEEELLLVLGRGLGLGGQSRRRRGRRLLGGGRSLRLLGLRLW